MKMFLTSAATLFDVGHRRVAGVLWLTTGGKIAGRGPDPPQIEHSGQVRAVSTTQVGGKLVAGNPKSEAGRRFGRFGCAPWALD